MSKGSPIVPIRIHPDLLSQIDAQIASSNLRREGAPWCRTDFLIVAIREKLAKMNRSRTRAPKKKGSAV